MRKKIIEPFGFLYYKETMGRNKCFERDEVIDKALVLFWRKGFADTSLQDIEKATGVNKSGLYNEFSGKDEMYTECLKRFGETSGVTDLLKKEPLGWSNVESFLLSSSLCEIQKGCFIANSVREISIIPSAARAQIGSHMQKVKEGITQNLKAAGVKTDLNVMVEMIISFNAGLALSLNAGENKTFKSQVKKFLAMLIQD
jgi:AcrR family transcriptional regulator